MSPGLPICSLILLCCHWQPSKMRKIPLSGSKLLFFPRFPFTLSSGNKMSAASELNCGYVRAKVKVSELLSSGHRTEGLYGREKGAHNVDMHGKKKKVMWKGTAGGKTWVINYKCLLVCNRKREEEDGKRMLNCSCCSTNLVWVISAFALFRNIAARTLHHKAPLYSNPLPLHLLPVHTTCTFTNPLISNHSQTLS